MVQVKLPKDGSRWSGNDSKIFFVIRTIDLPDGHTWVHYREKSNSEPREYSCYIESFLQRFRELPE
jgi:hypothetical protein